MYTVHCTVILAAIWAWWCMRSQSGRDLGVVAHAQTVWPRFWPWWHMRRQYGRDFGVVAHAQAVWQRFQDGGALRSLTTNPGSGLNLYPLIYLFKVSSPLLKIRTQLYTYLIQNYYIFFKMRKFY